MNPASAGFFHSPAMKEAPPWPCLRTEHTGSGKRVSTRVILDVSVSPNAPRTEVVGWHDGALRIRLQAPPVDGAANDALRRWLAQQLGLPQAKVELLRGHSARRKQWALATDADVVSHWLASLPALQK